MKDNFSNHADLYASYRPEYPRALYDYILSIVPETASAWDCGTGNGQVAATLASLFTKVCATDISAAQLQQAKQKDNITYSQQPAEQTDFLAASFDLIIVAQAIHWFDFDRFYAEVNRTLKPAGVLVVTGYGLIKIDEATDKLLRHFYTKVVGPYWDPERKYIDEDYKTIPFPFEELQAPALYHNLVWTQDQFAGYLNTWSAVQHYIKDTGVNPISLLKEELDALWPEGTTKPVHFPILLRATRKATGD